MALVQLFTAIANAIRNKKGTLELIEAEDFPTEIGNIQTGIDTSDATAIASDILKDKTAYADGIKLTGTLEQSAGFPPDWSQLGYSNTPEAIINDFNYSKEIYDNWDSSITSMQNYFKDNKLLTFLPLIDTSNVTNMVNAFNGSGLYYLPLIDTSNVDNMYYAFNICYNLSYISKINVDNVLNFNTAFQGCQKLKTIDIDFTTSFSKATNLSSMFNNCKSLTTINFGNIDNISRTTNLGTYSNMFSSCPELDDETLNNILKLLPKLIPTSHSTLKLFGLSSKQATRCQSLSNYQAFIDAGWTTGY